MLLFSFLFFITEAKMFPSFLVFLGVTLGSQDAQNITKEIPAEKPKYNVGQIYTGM